MVMIINIFRPVEKKLILEDDIKDRRLFEHRNARRIKFQIIETIFQLRKRPSRLLGTNSKNSRAKRAEFII